MQLCRPIMKKEFSLMPPQRPGESTASLSNGRVTDQKWPAPRSWERALHNVEQWIGDHPLPAAAMALSVGLLAALWMKRR